ncbi:hypothetical protein EXIGLDRAFT_838281 [Exidia glandulosa HHB12029]|uniref:Uncharacterized protein n=1 Tax=Exidia glandulosa HHB12029 TaxID=1314781 RepID=A0A165G126_EXIGL|nr:hypothetical protein EXIGLDRAFT_838281 [Exidia glandulosa HHB12029]
MFVVPNRAQELEKQLSDEIYDFLIAATVEANLRANDIVKEIRKSSRYNGEFRQLPHADIQKRYAVIRETVRKNNDGTVIEKVTFEKVRVDGEIMVLRTVTSPNSSMLESTTPWSVPYNENLLRRIVLTSAPSPYLALFYGTSLQDSLAKFSVIRGGTRDLLEFVRGLDEADKPKVCLQARLTGVSPISGSWKQSAT